MKKNLYTYLAGNEYPGRGICIGRSPDGTKAMIAIQQSERNGKVVAATLVRTDDEIMLISDTGVVVRTRVAEIREMGRATQGVTLIALDEGAQLIGLQRIVENDANEADASTPDLDAPAADEAPC